MNPGGTARAFSHSNCHSIIVFLQEHSRGSEPPLELIASWGQTWLWWYTCMYSTRADGQDGDFLCLKRRLAVVRDSLYCTDSCNFRFTAISTNVLCINKWQEHSCGWFSCQVNRVINHAVTIIIVNTQKHWPFKNPKWFNWGKIKPSIVTISVWTSFTVRFIFVKVDLQATKFYSLIYLNENIIFISDHFMHTQTQTDKDARLQHVDTSK